MGKFKIGDKVRFESMLGDIEGEVIELNAKQTVMDRSERGIVFKITRHPKQPSNIGKEMFVDNKSYWRLFTISENKMKKSELKKLIKEVLQEETKNEDNSLKLDLSNKKGDRVYIDCADKTHYDRVLKRYLDKGWKLTKSTPIKEATYDPEISDLASECLSMLAHPFFRRFIEKTDDPFLTDQYNAFYELIKDYE